MVIYRVAEKEDLEEVAALLAESFHGYGFLKCITPTEKRGYFPGRHIFGWIIKKVGSIDSLMWRKWVDRKRLLTTQLAAR